MAEGDQSTPEVKDTPKEKAKKLGWLGDQDPKEGTEGLGKLAKGLLAGGVVSLLIALLVVSLVAPTKGNLQSLSTDLDKRSSALEDRINSNLGQLESKSNTKSSSLETRIVNFESRLLDSEREVSSLEAKLSTLSTLSGLEGRVNTTMSSIEDRVNSTTSSTLQIIETELGDLESRIVDLEIVEEEEKESDSSIIEGVLSAKLETQFWDYIALPPVMTANETETVQVYLVLENLSGRDIRDIRLEINLLAEGYIWLDWTEGFPKLTGGSTNWDSPWGSSGYGRVTFVNGWGLNLKAGDYRSILLTLYFSLDEDYKGDVIIFEPLVDIDSFEFKK